MYKWKNTNIDGISVKVDESKPNVFGYLVVWESFSEASVYNIGMGLAPIYSDRFRGKNHEELARKYIDKNLP